MKHKRLTARGAHERCNRIREMHAKGYGPTEIARQTGLKMGIVSYYLYSHRCKAAYLIPDKNKLIAELRAEIERLKAGAEGPTIQR